MKKNLGTFCLSLIGTFGLILFSSLVNAKSLNLYDQPKADAKLIGTIDTANGIIPIYTPKDSAWVKIADPRNGNVGWVKQSDLNTTGEGSVTFTQRVISNDQIPSSFQLIEYGQPKKMTNKEIQEMMQKMQMRQRAMQKAIQDMMKDMGGVPQQFGGMGFPMVMPVVIMPMPPEQKEKITGKGQGQVQSNPVKKETQPNPQNANGAVPQPSAHP